MKVQAIVCEKCGGNLTEEAIFNEIVTCPYCGALLSISKDTAEKQTMKSDSLVGRYHSRFAKYTDKPVTMNVIKNLLAQNEHNYILGYDDSKAYILDKSDFSHFLVCGMIESGKTSFVRSLAAQIILQEEKAFSSKFIIFDSKRVEYTCFDDCFKSYLLLPIEINKEKANASINWVQKEYEARLTLFQKGTKVEEFSKIYCIYDDISELMSEDSFAESLNILLRRGQTVGIFVIGVTSTPLQIPNSIRDNFPNIVCFKVVDKSSSKKIIKEYGAERLISPGEFYYYGNKGFAKCFSCYCKHDDLELLIVQKRNANKDVVDTFNSDIFNIEMEKHCFAIDENVQNEKDELFFQAGIFIIGKEKASIGAIQRAFKIGFTRSAQIMDQLEECGVVGPETGTKPREILMDAEEFEDKFSSLDRISRITPQSFPKENTVTEDKKTESSEAKNTRPYWIKNNVCQYCGGEFEDKGVFFKKYICKSCKRKKDY